MTRRTWTQAAALVVLLAAILAFCLQRYRHADSGNRASKPTMSGNLASKLPGEFAAAPLPGKAPGTPTESAVAVRLERALQKLKSSHSEEESRAILDELHTYLESLPPDLAAAAMTSFLADLSNNALTRIEFAIGAGGFLSGQPSLRVALLDWLGQIDPEQAGVVASKVLATPTDADEWAVSLRDYARAYPEEDNREFLRKKTEELIRNPAWRANPSVGFFEAFDVFVHSHATESTGLLSELVSDRSPEGKPLAHASFLTLDRLTFLEPAAMMREFAARPDLFLARGEMVANLFARADLADPDQQQLVRNYLLDPARKPAELSAFSGVFPNANFAISKNLLSENQSLSREEIITRDAAALNIVNVWLADPAFGTVKPHLTTMQQRLEAFVTQSKAANEF